MAETVERKKKKRRRVEEETPKEAKKQKVSGPPPSFATAKSFRIKAVTTLKGAPPVLGMEEGPISSRVSQLNRNSHGPGSLVAPIYTIRLILAPRKDEAPGDTCHEGDHAALVFPPHAGLHRYGRATGR
jgi:hypothetical protein